MDNKQPVRARVYTRMPVVGRDALEDEGDEEWEGGGGNRDGRFVTASVTCGDSSFDTITIRLLRRFRKVTSLVREREKVFRRRGRTDDGNGARASPWRACATRDDASSYTRPRADR